MGVFKQYEEDVLDILLSGTLSCEQISAVKAEGKLSRDQHTGHGYLVSVTHPCLPLNRIICHTPMVVGSAEGIECNFSVFIDNGSLTIECDAVAIDVIPLDFRNFDVHISVA
jgi:hypothetical protein